VSGQSEGEATASASAALVIGSTGVSTTASNAVLSLAGPNSVNVGAVSQFAISVSLSTDGPVRPGFVTVSNSESWELDLAGDGGGSFMWSLGSISGQCSGKQAGIGGFGNCTNLGTTTFTFMLGTKFQLTESELIDDSASLFGETFDSSRTSSALDFQFTDATGALVQVSDPEPVPEPTSYVLAAIGLFDLSIRACYCVVRRSPLH
jgi:hypothetical protein